MYISFSDIRELAIKNKISDIDLEIVSCVNSASYNLSDNEFNLICDYVKQVWFKLDSTYLQLLADIVCDLYQGLDYGYRNGYEIRLTKNDLVKLEKMNKVVDIYYDKYY